MDFHLDEDLVAVGDLAREILTDRATPERLREVELSAARTDARLWADLAGAGLVGIGLPERYGGAGLGLAGLTVVLVEQHAKLALEVTQDALVLNRGQISYLGTSAELLADPQRLTSLIVAA